MASAADEILQVNQILIDAIAAGDWNTYASLVADDVTCFEPEARGQLVEGLPFHEYYFHLPKDSSKPSHPSATTIASPIVRMLSPDVALIAYVRLVQKLDENNRPVTRTYEETRIWRRLGGSWKLAHFHRSVPS